MPALRPRSQLHIAFYAQKPDIMKMMFPVILNTDWVRILLTGEGEALARRIALIREAKPRRMMVYAPDPTPAIRHEAESVMERFPERQEMRGAILFIAGLPREKARMLAEEARSVGALVNAEDIPDLCDFHVPSLLRRGDVLLTSSTAGKSPTLARALRDDMSRRYSPDWAARLNLLAAARRQWRADGLTPSAVADKSRAMIEDEKWLS